MKERIISLAEDNLIPADKTKRKDWMTDEILKFMEEENTKSFSKR